MGSVARPVAAARSLVSGLAAGGASRWSCARARPATCQALHSSAQLWQRRRRRFSNVLAEEMGLVTPRDVDAFSKEKFPDYTAPELDALGQQYTKEQMAALVAGEAAIDPHDMTVQGRLRTDIARPQYIDDYAVMQPGGIDRRPRTKPRPNTTRARFMSEAQFADDFFEWLDSFGPKAKEGLEHKAGADSEAVRNMTEAEFDRWIEEQVGRGLADPTMPSRLDVTRYLQDRPALAGVRSTGNTALAPDLGDDIPGVTELYRRRGSENDKDNHDPEGIYKALRAITGMTVRAIKDTPVKIVVIRKVANQTRLGKIQSSDVMAIAGDGNGRLGLGIGRSVDAGTATIKARLAAIRDMRPIVRYENRTIYGNIKAKISGTVVELFARPPGTFRRPLRDGIRRREENGALTARAGFGLRVPHRIFEICRAAGISDLAARIPRSRNPMNTVKAVLQALHNQPNPEDIAIGRGKKLVDVRKVYYGGAVY